MAYASGGLITASDYNSFSWGGNQGTYTASPVNLAHIICARSWIRTTE